MKAKLDAIIQREQAEYLDKLLPESTGLLAEMESYAAEHRVPIADREVAAFLEITARAIRARRVLECGMAIGYSMIHLARAMPDDGLVVTIDPSDEMIKAAEGYFARAQVRNRVQIEKGYALEVIPRLQETFDLVFIDARVYYWCPLRQFCFLLYPDAGIPASSANGGCRETKIKQFGNSRVMAPCSSEKFAADISSATRTESKSRRRSRQQFTWSRF